jgi:hypothetical protein
MDEKDYQRNQREIEDFFLALFKVALKSIDDDRRDSIYDTVDICIDPGTWDLLDDLFKKHDLEVQSMARTRDGVEISFAFGRSYGDIPDFPYSSVMFRLSNEAIAPAPCFFSRVYLDAMADMECFVHAEVYFSYKMTAQEFECLVKNIKQHVTYLELKQR